MHKCLVLICRAQDFAQSQKIVALSNDCDTMIFRNSAPTPLDNFPILHSILFCQKSAPKKHFFCYPKNGIPFVNFSDMFFNQKSPVNTVLHIGFRPV